MLRLGFLLPLILAACVRFPPTEPTPIPVPSTAPTPSAPGPLFRLYLTDHPPDANYLVAVMDASTAWEEAVHRPVFSWTEGRPFALMQFPVIQAGPLPSDVATGAITFREPTGLVIFSGQVPVSARRTTVLHELGHVIGLSHSTDPASVMFWKSNTQTITADDASNARTILTTSRVLGMSSISLTKVLACLYN